MKSCRARVTFSVSDKQAGSKKPELVASSIYSALVPELEFKAENAQATIALDGRKVVFEIKAENIADLRANINSYLRLASTSYRCVIT